MGNITYDRENGYLQKNLTFKWKIERNLKKILEKHEKNFNKFKIYLQEVRKKLRQL